MKSPRFILRVSSKLLRRLRRMEASGQNASAFIRQAIAEKLGDPELAKVKPQGRPPIRRRRRRCA